MQTGSIRVAFSVELHDSAKRNHGGYVPAGGETRMKQGDCAKTPPMGWNSYDYYDTTVNEEQVKANADYMAAHLKAFGWEYVVVDIEWYAYDTGSKREKYQYIPFGKVEMDGYGRLLPCPQRFPSAKDGAGFAPLADYVHALGLKFGIHIMRGIPREAAHRHLPVFGSSVTADEIAEPANICAWNPDMYGLNPAAEGAQAYYDSLLALYAEWGVDFIKCDDICRMDMPSARAEIAMLHRAIESCGRPMVLSLSPGPARVEEAWYYAQHANMWRITDDFWDHWDSLKDMFDRCELWQKHVSPGCYPDCDMLPLGKIGKAFGNERDTGFTRTEQVTMMNLWCIFRAPLMIGAELTKLDDWTMGLLTNECLLSCVRNGRTPKQLSRDEESAVWMNGDADGSVYLALFNIGERERIVSAGSRILEENDISLSGKQIRNVWSGEYAAGKAEQAKDAATVRAVQVQDATGDQTVQAQNAPAGSADGISVLLPAHGSVFLKLEPCAAS